MYNGSHRVKYRGAGAHTPYDFVLEAPHRPVDVSLVLPHFRARSQPLDHRLSLFVSSEGPDPIKAKVVSDRVRLVRPAAVLTPRPVP